MRILTQAQFGPVNAGARQQHRRPCQGIGARNIWAMGAETLNHLLANAPDRVERGGRVLENHCDSVAAQLAPLGFAGRTHVGAHYLQGPCPLVGGFRQQPHGCQGGERLAAAAFTDQAQHFTRGDGQIDAAYRLQCAERDAEVIDLQRHHLSNS